MQRIRAAFLTLFLTSCSTGFSQGYTRREAAELTKFSPKVRRGDAPVPIRHPPEAVQIHFLLHMRSPLLPDTLTEQFLSVVYEMETSIVDDEQPRITNLRQRKFELITQQLQNSVALRIPTNATEAQRAKLQVAALIDMRHTVSELKASYAMGGPRIPERFRKAKEAGEFDIFGSGSLFDKVMRQQALSK